MMTRVQSWFLRNAYWYWRWVHNKPMVWIIGQANASGDWELAEETAPFTAIGNKSVLIELYAWR